MDKVSSYTPMEELTKIIKAIIIALMIFSVGIAGYMIIERWSLIDSVYMTAVTLSTVGFMEVHEISNAGRIFTIILIFAGVGYFLFLASIIMQSIVEGEIQSLLGRKRLDKKIRKLKQHYIVCG